MKLEEALIPVVAVVSFHLRGESSTCQPKLQQCGKVLVAQKKLFVCDLVEVLLTPLKEFSVIHILCLITSSVTPNHNQRLKFQLEGNVLNV